MQSLDQGKGFLVGGRAIPTHPDSSGRVHDDEVLVPRLRGDGAVDVEAGERNLRGPLVALGVIGAGFGDSADFVQSGLERIMRLMFTEVRR